MLSLRPRRAGAAVLALAMLLVAGPAYVEAASTLTVAVLGDPAPGGGVFAGPGFTGWPAAAGSGWMAFRGEVFGGGTSEAMVVARMVQPRTRMQVASIGEPAPGGGTFKQFVGRPAVNTNGDVAFLAELTSGGEDDSSVDSPAGIFLFRANQLIAVARSGQATDAGKINLLAPLDPSADPSDVSERTPALNDAGDVAFLAATPNERQTPAGGIFLARVDQAPAAVVRIGDRFDGGASTFASFGAPALNASRMLAFHAMVTSSQGGDDGLLAGIFTAGPDATPPALMVREGTPVMPLDLPLRVFEDAVSLNDHGDMVFLAGPLASTFEATEGLEDSPGVILCSGGVLTAVAYPGGKLGPGHVSSFRLGPAAGSGLVPPVIAPDGRIAFFASLDGGNQEVIAVWQGGDFRLLFTGGASADTIPDGGTYAGTSSAPALDALGGVAFRARIVGSVTSEALVYQPAEGPASLTVVGDAAPGSGFFAGKPFSNPVLNDSGDVVFRAFLARGAASVGIFRSRGGTLEPVVRSGDPAPGIGAPFVDLLGQPSVNALGDIAFVGQVPERGLGIYVVADTGSRLVVATGDPVPGEDSTVFRTLSLNPSLNDDGAVAFRAITLHREGEGGERTSRDGIFLADGAGIRALARVGDPAPGGLPFFRLRDPVVTNVPSVAFRASLGETKEEATGIFVADDAGVTASALEEDDLGTGIALTRVTSDPMVTSSGELAFLAIRSRQMSETVRKALGPSILQSTSDGLGLVVAQDMPGPAGGTFRNLSPPAVNGLGHVAFRGSFLAGSGGVGGIFLATEHGLEPYLTIGDATPAGGRFSSFGSRIALNAQDDLAFTATLARGTSRTGIFLASRTHLEVRPLVLRIGGRAGRDRIRVRLGLNLGRLSNGIDPGHDPVTVSVSDGRGVLWSTTVSAGLFRRRGRAFVAVPRRGSPLASELGHLRLELGRHGMPVVSAVSAPVHIAQVGSLVAPVSVTLQVGDDSGTRALPCRPGPHGLRCRAR